MAMALFLFIGLMIIGVLAVFCYETSRILLVRDQLKTCADIAALSGETTLLSSTQNFSTAQNTAKNTALNMFRRNSILGIPMTGVTAAATPSSLSPPSGQAQVCFEFIDPVSGTVGGPNSNILRVTSAYSYQLFGGNFMGIGNSVYTVAVTTKAALPSLDIYLLLDLSSSMDDQTPVSTVLRKWDPSVAPNGKPRYFIPGTAPAATGNLDNVFCRELMGNPINALPPQHLDTSQAPFGVPCNKCFSEVRNASNPTAQTSPLRGLSDDHPPGDTPPPGGVGPMGLTAGPAVGGGYAGVYSFAPKKGDEIDPLFEDKGDPYVNVATMHAAAEPHKKAFWPVNQSAEAQVGAGPASYPQCTFTHMVVNIDGNNNFGGYSAFGFNFPSTASLVEASIGNLESSGAANNACLDLPNIGGITPRSGYQDAYRISACSRIEPLSSIVSSTTKFLTKIRYSTDPHYGLVTFSTEAGNSPGDTMQDWNVSWAFPMGGAARFPIPGIHVSPGADNFNTTINTITPPSGIGGGSNNLMVSMGGANIAQALSNALDHLDPNGPSATTRPGATRAIVLVTDGLPTVDLARNRYATPPPTNNPAQADARSQAARAKAAGIPIYVLALSQDASMNSHMDAIYNDSSSGGIAYESGQGAKYYLVNWSGVAGTRQRLDATFGNIARQLVNLVK